MTATAAPTVKHQELVSLGLVESASVNSFADFVPSKLSDSPVTIEKDKDAFINTFICHLIFYAIFCISLVVHILLDLGLGSFIKNKFVQLIGFRKKTFFEKGPAFAQ
tara:strand:- start:1853 stop:2173 length:321 start_codon:yes stop_codon:yes gene_type:complete